MVFIFNKFRTRKIEYSEHFSDDSFDKKYNVETARIIKTGDLETKSKNWKYAVRYEPTDSRYTFSQILSSFSINYSEYTFIDMGSGKGRVILLASMLPFKRILGVEFSETLIDIAKTNISRFPSDLQLCKKIEFLSMDASDYTFPDPAEKFVLFMNNPFHQPVMEKVMKNLSNSFYLNPRRLIIIYINPQFSPIIEKLPFLQKHDYPDDLNSDLYKVKAEYV
jgi:SAM-dependent methyltransferase